MKSKRKLKKLIIYSLIYCLTFYSCDKTVKEYYENGRIKSEIIKNWHGNYDDVAKFYNSEGNIEKVVLYDNGSIKECSVFYKSGTLKWLCPYKSNIKDGLYKEFYETGEVKKIVNYVKGEKVSYLEYDSLGLLVYKFVKIDTDTLIPFNRSFVQIHDTLKTTRFVSTEIHIPKVVSTQIRPIVINGEIRKKNNNLWEIKKNVRNKPTILNLRILVNDSTEINYGSISFP